MGKNRGKKIKNPETDLNWVFIRPVLYMKHVELQKKRMLKIEYSIMGAWNCIVKETF